MYRSMTAAPSHRRTGADTSRRPCSPAADWVGCDRICRGLRSPACQYTAADFLVSSPGSGSSSLRVFASDRASRPPERLIAIGCGRDRLHAIMAHAADLLPLHRCRVSPRFCCNSRHRHVAAGRYSCRLRETDRRTVDRSAGTGRTADVAGCIGMIRPATGSLTRSRNVSASSPK